MSNLCQMFYMYFIVINCNLIEKDHIRKNINSKKGNVSI